MEEHNLFPEGMTQVKIRDAGSPERMGPEIDYCLEAVGNHLDQNQVRSLILTE